MARRKVPGDAWLIVARNGKQGKPKLFTRMRVVEQRAWPAIRDSLPAVFTVQLSCDARDHFDVPDLTALVRETAKLMLSKAALMSCAKPGIIIWCDTAHKFTTLALWDNANAKAT